uniref:1-acyl-sn-glycerol-3-phosphate acyltransferase n=1 Tax=Mesocestoides corti TaxID=53468 RepID=A0A5K3G290_MESCO
MVWKIFAPRLIFSLFCLGTVCLTVVLVRTLALRCLRQLCVGGRRLAASKD